MEVGGNRSYIRGVRDFDREIRQKTRSDRTDQSKAHAGYTCLFTLHTKGAKLRAHIWPITAEPKRSKHQSQSTNAHAHTNANNQQVNHYVLIHAQSQYNKSPTNHKKPRRTKPNTRPVNQNSLPISTNPAGDQSQPTTLASHNLLPTNRNSRPTNHSNENHARAQRPRNPEPLSTNHNKGCLPHIREIGWHTLCTRRIVTNPNPDSNPEPIRVTLTLTLSQSEQL